MRIKLIGTLCAFLLVVIVLAACGNEEEKESQSPADQPNSDNEQQVEVGGYDGEQVTVTFLNSGASIDPETFEQYFQNPMQKIHPNITLERVEGSMDELIAANEIPDIIAVSNKTIFSQLDFNLGFDIAEMILRDNVDLEKFLPEIHKDLQRLSDDGSIWGMPFAMNYGVTAYNKEIFDRFAVEYPRDGMTYSEAIDLMKKLTRVEDGVRFVGMITGNAQHLVRQYSLPVADENGDPNLTSEGFNTVFGVLKEVFETPDLVDFEKQQHRFGWNGFFNEQRIAMAPHWFGSLHSQLVRLDESEGGVPFDWDITSYPAFDDRPDLGRQLDYHMLMMTSTSKNHEAAFEVLKMASSEDMQMKFSKSGRISVLREQSIRDALATDFDLFEGKNLDGMFAVNPAPAPTITPYDDEIYKILNNKEKEMALEGKDINTILREADAEAEQIIREIDALEQKD